MRQKQKTGLVAKICQGIRLINLISQRLIFGGWSMVLIALSLPYQAYKVFIPARKKRFAVPPSHPISKFFTQAFESKKIKKLAGGGLASVLMLSSLISNIASANEPTIDKTMISILQTQISTESALNWPLKGAVGQKFHSFHRAIDILAPIGSIIKPIDKGRVVEAEYGRLGWGNTVVIEHENKLKSRYAHLKDIYVIEGQTVTKEFPLGTVGMTGWTTGPHLHLELYQDGKPIDPLTVLPDYPIK